VDDLWATKSEDVGLIVSAISFQDFQPMWSWSTNIRDRWTDRQTTCDCKTVLCTVVHHVVKAQAVLLTCIFMTVAHLTTTWRWASEWPQGQHVVSNCHSLYVYRVWCW